MNTQIAKGDLMNENISFANEQPQRAFLLLFYGEKSKNSLYNFPCKPRNISCAAKNHDIPLCKLL